MEEEDGLDAFQMTKNGKYCHTSREQTLWKVPELCATKALCIWTRPPLLSQSQAHCYLEEGQKRVSESCPLPPGASAVLPRLKRNKSEGSQGRRIPACPLPFYTVEPVLSIVKEQLEHTVRKLQCHANWAWFRLG